MRKIVLLLVLFSSYLIAQNKSINGFVLDAMDNHPLQYANVYLEKEGIGVSTNKNGQFILEGKIENNDILTISFVGYESDKILVSDFLSSGNNEIKLRSKVISSQTVLIEASFGKDRVSKPNTANVTRRQIEKNYVKQEVPEYLSYFPSTSFYSEGGTNIGYNYLSIRGFDQRRISVAVNGIPQNDPEDNNLYWVNLPGLLNNTELIQVQRGAGAGVIGYPSIGGAINIVTSNFSDKPKFELSTLYGSYNTRKYRAAFSSGLIDKKYSFSVDVSHLMSDGYKDENWMNAKSYHISAVRYDENLTSQINIYGGPFEDGLVYTGIAKFAVKDKDLRKKNYSYWTQQNGEYTWTTPRKPEEKEAFSQPHYELLNEYKVNDDLKFNSALFLVFGDGYFDYDGSWTIWENDYYRLNQNGYGEDQIPQNAIIRAMVENTQFGWIPRMSWNHGNGQFIAGLELRKHRSVHWGSIQYAENLPSGVDQEYKYYYYKGGKDIINFFVNENYELNEKLSVLAEAQIAYHNYKIFDEKYVGNEFDIDGLYLNPKFGINYKVNETINSFITAAYITREPRLKNYYDAAESSGGAVPQFNKNNDGTFDFEDPLVKPESMLDIELGATLTKKDYSLSANLFYMNFSDEIVKKGQLDRFGQPITGNVDKTIHTGIELSGSVKLGKYFTFIANGTYSKNYISEGSAYLKWYSPIHDGPDAQGVEIDLKDNAISGFPELMFNGILKFDYENFSSELTVKYMGDFRSDNYDDKLTSILSKYPGIIGYDDNKVDSYFVVNFYTSFEMNLNPALQNVKLFVQVNNVLDELYAAYAVGEEFFPAAERNISTGIQIGL
ncbi:MAG: TonB-dependent receptor [Melioribacteraceae bacterium]|nr:TonB-dependent receptor [Melioribacteraceae bacterium]